MTYTQCHTFLAAAERALPWHAITQQLRNRQEVIDHIQQYSLDKTDLYDLSAAETRFSLIEVQFRIFVLSQWIPNIYQLLQQPLPYSHCLYHFIKIEPTKALSYKGDTSSSSFATPYWHSIFQSVLTTCCQPLKPTQSSAMIWQLLLFMLGTSKGTQTQSSF